MEWFIVVGVILAILAEFFTILYTLYEVIRQLARKKSTTVKAEIQEKESLGTNIEMIPVSNPEDLKDLNSNG